MFIRSLTDRGATPGLIQLLSYTQQRHAIIAENIANLDTPGYQAKRLDLKAFQASLGQAMRERGVDPRAPLQLRPHEQFELDSHGALRAMPVTTPPRNVLFHDGTTLSIEQEMADLAGNAMLHQAATSLLKGKFEDLMSAIRGRA